MQKTQGVAGTKEPRHVKLRSIISLSKTTHKKVWHDDRFSKRNKATKRAEREGVGKKLRKGW